MKKYLRNILGSNSFNLFVLFLLLISVILLLAESFATTSDLEKKAIEKINWWITLILIAELCMRWLICKSTKRFFSEHWIDILAILPMLRIFRFAQYAYLLRFLRIFSLGALLHKRLYSLTKIVKNSLSNMAYFYLF